MTRSNQAPTEGRIDAFDVLDERWVRVYRRSASVVAVFVAALALGWVIRANFKPAPGVLFDLVLLVSALGLLSRAEWRSPRFTWATRVSGLAAVSVSVYGLFGFEQQSGLSLGFILLAVALLAATFVGEWAVRISELGALTAAALSFYQIANSVFSYRASVNAAHDGNTRVAAGLLLLGVGLFVSRPENGIMRQLASSGHAPGLMRRFVTVSLLGPITFFIGHLLWARLGSVAPESSVASLMVVWAGTGLFCAVWTARRLSKHERERARIHDRAIQDEKRLAIALGNIGDAVIWTDVDGSVVDMNPAAVTLCGRSLQDCLGSPVQDVLPLVREQDQESTSPVRDALASGKSRGGEQLLLLSRSGDSVPVTESAAVLRDREGHVSGALMVLRDARDQRQSELLSQQRIELLAQTDQALEASRSKSRVLATMSHELRTPLNAILGFSEMLLVHKLDSRKTREFLRDIHTSGRHLLALITDVLELSRAEAHVLEFRPEEVEIEPLLGEVMAVVRGTSLERGVELGLTVDPALGSVETDPTRLRQIALNYVSNAIKFTPAGGRVLVRAMTEGALGFRIEVEDTGIGISEEDIAKLFTPFQRLNRVGKDYPGTGLGLALTKHMVEEQGGRVGVESAPGKGSCFFAVLPRRAKSKDHGPLRQSDESGREKIAG